MTKIIDLSVPITAKGHLRANPTITYWDHKTYAKMRMEGTGPGRTRPAGVGVLRHGEPHLEPPYGVSYGRSLALWPLL